MGSPYGFRPSLAVRLSGGEAVFDDAVLGLPHDLRGYRVAFYLPVIGDSVLTVVPANSEVPRLGFWFLMGPMLRMLALKVCLWQLGRAGLACPCMGDERNSVNCY